MCAFMHAVPPPQLLPILGETFSQSRHGDGARCQRGAASGGAHRQQQAEGKEDDSAS